MTIIVKFYLEEKIDETELLKPLENGNCPFYPNKTRGIDLFCSIMEWILTLGMLICLALYYYEFQVSAFVLSVKFNLRTRSTAMYIN